MTFKITLNAEDCDCCIQKNKCDDCTDCCSEGSLAGIDLVVELPQMFQEFPEFNAANLVNVENDGRGFLCQGSPICCSFEAIQSGPFQGRVGLGFANIGCITVTDCFNEYTFVELDPNSNCIVWSENLSNPFNICNFIGDNSPYILNFHGARPAKTYSPGGKNIDQLIAESCGNLARVRDSCLWYFLQEDICPVTDPGPMNWDLYIEAQIYCDNDLDAQGDTVVFRCKLQLIVGLVGTKINRKDPPLGNEQFSMFWGHMFVSDVKPINTLCDDTGTVWSMNFKTGNMEDCETTPVVISLGAESSPTIHPISKRPSLFSCREGQEVDLSNPAPNECGWLPDGDFTITVAGNG